MDEKIRLALLSQLIDAIQDNVRPGNDLNHLYVHFKTQRGRLICDCFGVADAFKMLRDDVYRFEEFDLRDARQLEVHIH